MKKIVILAVAAMLSMTAVQAGTFQDGKKANKECCCPKCDDKCKKECGDKCKDGKCSKADCAKPGDAKKDCCKKEKQS
jgi:hypothetical protein